MSKKKALYVTEEVHMFIKELAESKGLSMSEVVEQALKLFQQILQKKEK